MKKFEYKYEPYFSVHDILENLNKYGDEGWELCIFEVEYKYAIFKREKQC